MTIKRGNMESWDMKGRNMETEMMTYEKRYGGTKLDRERRNIGENENACRCNSHSRLTARDSVFAHFQIESLADVLTDPIKQA